MKKKNSMGGGTAIVKVEEREPDDYSPDKLMGMVIDELMDGISKKDRAAIRSALGAFVQLVKEEDND